MATLTIKVVPGSSRDRIVGRLGDAIKVQVSAALERGKANAAVISVIADAIGMKPAEIILLRGQTQPRKVLQINALTQAELDRRISEFL